PDLSVTTVHSALNVSGKVNLTDTTGHFQITAHPLGWQDVAAYIGDFTIRKDINMSLGIYSDKKQSSLKFSAKTAGIKGFSAKAKFRRDPAPVLTSLKISANQIDLDSLLDDTTTQRLRDFRINTNGHLAFDDYQHSSLKTTFS